MTSSLRWCLKLYCLVLAGLGLFLTGVWVIFQLYVLSQTTNQELRQQRWVFKSALARDLVLVPNYSTWYLK